MKTHALLMIDFQRDFCALGGYADQHGGVAWAREIIPAAQRLLTAARASGIFIVHTREGYAPDLSDVSSQKLARSKAAGAEIGKKGPLGRLLIRNEYGHDFIEELRPLPNELIIDKPTYGAFCRSSLELTLDSKGINTVVIAGVTADVCVHTTLREAIDRGFDARYVRDAISTFDPGIRHACEQMIGVEGGIWGKLTTVDEMISTWRNAS
jgi:nicotinamidase-related amidase